MPRLEGQNARPMAGLTGGAQTHRPPSIRSSRCCPSLSSLSARPGMLVKPFCRRSQIADRNALVIPLSPQVGTGTAGLSGSKSLSLLTAERPLTSLSTGWVGKTRNLKKVQKVRKGERGEKTVLTVLNSSLLQGKARQSRNSLYSQPF